MGSSKSRTPCFIKEYVKLGMSPNRGVWVIDRIIKTIHEVLHILPPKIRFVKCFKQSVAKITCFTLKE
jgi:hypothetical protein